MIGAYCYELFFHYSFVQTRLSLILEQRTIRACVHSLCMATDDEPRFK